MNHPPDHIKAVATTPELLAAAAAFEATACAFGAASVAYVKAMRQDPNRQTFSAAGATFEADPYRRTVLILTHVAKPHPQFPDRRTLQPFVELLVRQGIREARLVSPGPYTAWVEVTRGERWIRLRPEAAPTPTTETDREEPTHDPDTDTDAAPA